MRQRNDKVLMISYLMNPGKGSKSRIPSKFAIDCQPLSGMFTIHIKHTMAQGKFESI